ncbi:MAG: PPOX class F420-dependent oxidoreductase [Actinomycetota bacterium]|nr:PPOX class F420-dependent oxidoreductase [Actinomycetota bacterium]
MEERVRKFLEEHHSAVMATIKADGRPHVARIGCGLVDGKLWSSGTQDRARTRFLRRDPRATLFVFDESNAYHWLGLECTVTILDGPEAVDQNLALYRTLAGEPKDLEEYRAAMVAEKRLIYEFRVERSYGQG